VQPFRIDVPQADLDDLAARLDRTRLPEALPGSGWELGCDQDALAGFVEHWRHRYDWRAEEARINAVPQVVARCNGERVHALHRRSAATSAVPLVLLHGWPGSVVEFLDVIEPLADPVAHGGDAADACHVVVPSMPGYGFSGPTRHRGVDVHAVAEGVADLMTQLGYERFVVQGGDWGALVARRLAEAHPDRVVGHHSTMLFAMPAPGDPDAMEGVSAEDLERLQRAGERIADGTGYMAIQSTRPHSLTVAQHDSPAGLLAWILEKFHAWSDLGDGDLADVYDPDRLLTNVMLYWLTGTAQSAARLYCESARAGTAATDPWSGTVTVPTGHAVYPGELLQTPRAWAERRYPIVHWSEQPRGGHFAAFEQPGLFVDDLRTFLRVLRAG
jgi:epoxide hydrolase